jgi:cytosine/adenosine deaminase-related metal-dependent hydrolase
MRWLLAVLPGLVLTLAGCPGPSTPPTDGGPLTDAPDAGTPGEDAGTDAPEPVDAGTDAPLEDAPAPSDAPAPTDAPAEDAPSPTDAGVDAGSDAGMPGPSTPTPPPTVTRTGTGGLLLLGTILTPTGPLVGELLIAGNRITCVAPSCAGMPMAGTVTVIDTHGATISPGLLDAHDHLSYDFIPEWVPSPPRLFDSRYEWRGNAAYGDWVEPENVTAAVCAGSKWGELRSIIHGTTTIQGQSPAGVACVDRLARNADNYHGLWDGPDADTIPDDFMRVTISGPCESGFPARTGLITDFGDGDARRFVVHVGEGVRPAGTPGSSTDPTREFDCYAGRTGPTPGLLFDPSGVPYETGVMIHAIPLTAAQLDEAVMANVRFVWSPSSNIVLYDDTAPIEEMLARGLTVALANDWTVSGTDEMLSEMRYAHDYGQTMGITALTPRRLWEMETMDAAVVLGLEDFVGTIEVGRRADIAVFSRTGDDPYRAVMDSRARDVSLTLIDGVAYYGDLPLESIAVNGSCDTLDVCGIERFLCVADTPGTQNVANTTRRGDTLGSLEAELNGIIDTTLLTTPGAADRVLPLVDCSL